MKLIAKIGILVFLTLTINAQTQTFEWLKTHSLDYEYNTDYLSAATSADQDGNVYFFGLNTFSQNYGIYTYGSLFLRKYNSDGELLFEKIIEGEGTVSGLINDQNGNTIIYGSNISPLDFWGEFSLQEGEITTNQFVVKINQNGNVLWGKSFNQFEEYIASIMDVAVDNQNNLYVGYDTWSDSFIAEISPDGEVINTIVQENVKSISSLTIDTQGNLIVAGSCADFQCKFNAIDYECPFTYNNYLVKYNTSRNPLWVKFVDDITCTFPKVKTDDNNNIYWSGPLFVETQFGNLHAMGPNWIYDFFLVKLNPQGEYQWLREVPEVTTGDATTGSLNHLSIQPDGNILIAGYTRGTIDWGNGIVSENNGFDLDVMVLNYSPDGALNWVKTAGGASRDRATSVSCDGNNNISIAGYAGNTVSFDSLTYNSEDFVYSFLAKLDAETITSIEDDSNQNPTTFKVYPNPSAHKINLDLAEYRNLKILNTEGRVVYNSAKKILVKSIDISGLSPGLYFVTVEKMDGSQAYSKLIKQ